MRRMLSNQSGMALVMVMGVLAVTMLLVVHIMCVCEVISRESYVDVQKYNLRTVAESAAEQTFWMHLVDRKLFSNRTIGQSLEERIGNELEDVWMTDRRVHTPFPDQSCESYIAAVEKTLVVNEPTSFQKNIPIDDTERTEEVENFLDLLRDYVDSDSVRMLNGKDTEDYEAEGLLAMPRNEAMQFREELYWLDGWENSVRGELTIVPPNGKSFSSNATKPSFFSASEQEIREILHEESEDFILQVLQAQQAWTQDHQPIEDSLDVDALTTVKQKFNFRETNVAEYIAIATSPDRSIRSTFRFIRQCDMTSTSIFADSNSQSLSIWSQTTR